MSDKYTPEEQLARINQFCKDGMDQNNEVLIETTGESQNLVLPDPKNDRERAIYASGQLQAYLFFYGATMGYGKKPTDTPTT